MFCDLEDMTTGQRKSGSFCFALAEIWHLGAVKNALVAMLAKGDWVGPHCQTSPRNIRNEGANLYLNSEDRFEV